MVYLEFADNRASRQVENYSEKWFISNEIYHPETGGLALCDQPLSYLDLGEEHEISKNEFENIWNQALKNVR
ncbi:hypothetical protein [Nostoc sp.]|uniref:hypothetical protein n=1 Tax=Nostoc sp. TaxID=1180 RepID=UPI002FF9055C